MKKIIALLGLLVCFCSCGPVEYTTYEYKISYSIQGLPIITETHQVDMPHSYYPAYKCGNGVIQIIGTDNSSYALTYKTIYKGDLNVKVTDFDYNIVRHYKASSFSGREIKNKK